MGEGEPGAPAEDPGHFAMWTRCGTHDLNWTLPPVVFKGRDDQFNIVVEADPGHKLTALAEGAAEAPPEDRQHLTEGTTPRARGPFRAGGRRPGFRRWLL